MNKMMGWICLPGQQTDPLTELLQHEHEMHGRTLNRAAT